MTKTMQNDGLDFVRAQLSGKVNLPESDQALLQIIQLGDVLRAQMSPEIEVEYTDEQIKAIRCATAFEIGTDTGLNEFDFEAADREIEAMFEPGELDD